VLFLSAKRIYLPKGAKWKSDALFRDYLIAHPARAKTYANLKKKLAKQYPLDRGKYTAGKDPFIKATLRLARQANRQKVFFGRSGKVNEAVKQL
jgi:GrpB-like predicted nucleotidyltransferase (UPF0157 family)